VTSTSLGGAFERGVKRFLEYDPEDRLLVRRVWLWDQWHSRWGTDTGIDLVEPPLCDGAPCQLRA